MSVLDKLIVRGRAVFKMHSAAETKKVGVPDGTLRLYNDGTNAFLQVFSRSVGAEGAWETFNPAALLPPTNAEYLVGTSNASLSSEIVVGASPGGELGGSWGAPTVDATHSGSAHHAESHSVVSHSDTSATGSELDELTDGSETTLHGHASGAPGLIVSDDAEYTTTSTVAADVRTISGLSVPKNHTIWMEFTAYLDNNSGAAREFGLGLEINGTEVFAPLLVFASDGVDSEESSMSARVQIPPHDGNHQRGGFFETIGWSTNSGVITGGYGVNVQSGLAKDAPLPNATTTSLTIRGRVGGTSCTLRVDHIRIWELPN